MSGLGLLVVYTARLTECVDFYRGLGLRFVAERHGTGPEHYAAELADGTVLELYPARTGRETGALRLGLSVDGANGVRLVTDPDGRTVEVRGPLSGAGGRSG
ncbi:VOC family protein [Kitasatospora sp. NPDC051853]|uniref:VOC family protein n=1 Tax=Kitasatospora sp. NPDC051853 TaxID=3364058 RepID=UPI0037B57995